MRTAEKRGRGGLFSGGYGTLGHTNKILVSQARPHRFFHPAWPFGGIVLYFSGKGRQNQLATKYCLLRNSQFYIT